MKQPPLQSASVCAEEHDSTSRRKSVAVYTISYSSSPGAHYQALALCTFLDSIGYTATLVHWGFQTFGSTSNFISFTRRFKHRQTTKRYVAETLNFSRTYLRNRVIKQVDDDSLKDYSALIVGSDQVFNASLCGYGFFFEDVKKTKKISYAASLGRYDPKDDDKFKSLLMGFSALSFRETPPSSLSAFFIQRHLDPTFLLTKEQWSEILAPYPKKKKKYLLCFGLSGHKYSLEYAKRIAKEKKLTLVVTNYRGNDPLLGIRLWNKDNCLELLSLIRDAACVLTHSYHGFVMSLIFNVEAFYFVDNDPTYCNDPRFDEVVTALGLPERNLTLLEGKAPEPLDWERINQRIAEERQRSKEYLLEALG